MGSSTRTYRMSARAEAVERTRRAILVAAWEAFKHQPYDDVSLARVARDAGVSSQTLLNHFPSKEQLLLSVGDLASRELAELRGPVAPGDVGEAVEALLREYESLGDLAVQFVALADRIETLRVVRSRGQVEHRAWLESVFGEALPTDPEPRARALAALYAATDVGTWKLLRRDLGHSRAETAAVLRTLVSAVLATPPDQPSGTS